MLFPNFHSNMSRMGQPDLLWVSSGCIAFQRFIDYIGTSVDQFGYISRPEGLLYIYKKDRQIYDFRRITLPGHTWKTGWGMYGAVQYAWLPDPITPTGTYGELSNLVQDDIPVRVWLTSYAQTEYTVALMRQDGFEFLDYEEGFPGVRYVLFSRDGDSIYGDKVSDEEGACEICHQIIYDLAQEERVLREQGTMKKVMRGVRRLKRSCSDSKYIGTSKTSF